MKQNNLPFINKNLSNEEEIDQKDIYINEGPILKINEFDIVSILEKKSNQTSYLVTKPQSSSLLILKLYDSDQKIDSVIKDIKSNELKHQNILPLLSSFFFGPKIVLIFPFCFFRSLSFLVKTHFPSGVENESFVLSVIKQVSSALVYLNQGHTLHRDIRPENLLVNKEGNIFLKNFVFSQKLVEDGNLLSGRKSLVGTPCYVAPEMIDSERSYDGKMDLWALGISALEIQFGKPPFEEEFSQTRVLYKIAVEDKPIEKYYSKRFEKCSEGFKRLIRKILRKDPKERISAKELLEEEIVKSVKEEKEIVKGFLERFEEDLLRDLKVREKRFKESVKRSNYDFEREKKKEKVLEEGKVKRKRFEIVEADKDGKNGLKENKKGGKRFEISLG